MHAVFDLAHEDVPQLGRLPLDVPATVARPPAKDALLCANRLLVTPNPDDDAAILLACDQGAQPGRLSRCRARAGRQRLIDTALGGTHLVAQIEIPRRADLVAKPVDFGQLHPGVQERDRERYLSQERFARHPEQRGAVLAHRPQHTERRDAEERFAQNIDGTGFEFVQVGGGAIVHDADYPVGCVRFPRLQE